MEILGKLPGSTVVLNKTDGASALKLVDDIPDTPGETDSHTIQLRVNVGDHRRGDIFVYKDFTWQKVQKPTQSVVGVTNVIRPRINQDVQIRWMDPSDQPPYTWKHTLLLRKYGEYPQDALDGIIVVDSYVRHQYRTDAYHDYVPAGTEDGWYYRFFTFSEDEVAFSDENCMFRPIALDWANLPYVVDSGLAGNVFALGDEISVDIKPEFKSHPFYKDIRFVVSAFNQATPEDLTKSYSVTFALASSFGDALTNWDWPWPEFTLTNDAFVTNPSKVYYIKLDDGSGYSEVSGLPMGKRLEPDTYYEKTTENDRRSKGGNRWALSTLRSWLNSTDPANTWKFVDKYGITWDVPPPLTVVTDDVRNAIAPIRNVTALPVGEDRAMSDYEISIDSLYLMSATEVHGDTPTYIYYLPTSDRTPINYGVTEDDEPRTDQTYFIYIEALATYRKAEEGDFDEDHRFKPGVTYFELRYYLQDPETREFRIAVTADYTDSSEFKDGVLYHDQIKSIVEENPQLPYFSDEELEPRIIRDSDGEPCEWWLRTADIMTITDVLRTDKNGLLNEGDESYKGRHALVFAFTVA